MLLYLCGQIGEYVSPSAYSMFYLFIASFLNEEIRRCIWKATFRLKAEIRLLSKHNTRRQVERVKTLVNLMKLLHQTELVNQKQNQDKIIWETALINVETLSPTAARLQYSVDRKLIWHRDPNGSYRYYQKWNKFSFNHKTRK